MKSGQQKLSTIDAAYADDVHAAKAPRRFRLISGTRDKPTMPASAIEWERVLSGLPQLVWVTDPGGQCIYVNRTFEVFTGAPAGSLMNASWTTFLHPDDMDQTSADWLHSVRHATVHEARYRIRRHDHTYRWMLARAVLVSDASGRASHWLGTNTDVHDLYERAEQSHGCTSAGALDAKPCDTRSTSASQVTDLRDTVLGELENLATVFPKRLIVKVTEQSIPGVWSAGAMRHVLDILIANAARYGQPDALIGVSLECAEGRATLSVHNNLPARDERTRRGKGVPSPIQMMPMAPDMQGWGRGLRTVKCIADAHGGIVQVESSTDQGTTVRVVFPATGALRS